MCEYCDDDMKTLLERKYDIFDKSLLGWAGNPESVKTDDKAYFSEETASVFIDRGFIRLVDPTDCNCMEAGEKIKINFCPMCGNKPKES